MAKVGRPKKDNSRNERMSLRLGKEEMFELELCSAETGLSKPEIIRNNLRMICNLTRHNAKK